MDQMTRIKLQQAYELIKIKDFVAARPLVISTLAQYPDHVDVLWMAVLVNGEDFDEQRELVQRILAINPGHAKAQALAKKLTLTIVPDHERPVVTNSRPAQKVVIKKRNAKADRRNRIWLWRFTAFASMWVVSLLILDSFMGWGYFQPIEEALLGKPEAIGFVADEGGQIAVNEQGTPDSAAVEAAIPIIKEEEIRNTTSGIQIDTLNRGQAHAYRFPAYAGTEVMIAINFLNDRGAQNVAAIEVWNAQGRVVAREERFSEFISDANFDLAEVGGEAGAALQEQFDAMLSMRMIQFVPPATGTYTLNVVSRDGGPSGNYSLMITTTEAALDGSLDGFID